jgi:hypothetical protein
LAHFLRESQNSAQIEPLNPEISGIIEISNVESGVRKLPSSSSNKYSPFRKTAMQSQRFIQLELPLTFQKMDTLEHMEQSIEAMLDLTWNAVIAHISRPSTKKLMSDQGKLIALSNGKARIRFSSQPLCKLAQAHLPEIEAAFQKAFGYKVSISLEY